MTSSTLVGDLAFGLGGIHAWAMATAAVIAASCALVGTLLVVRRMSLVGDAISHAVLPGIAVAVLAGGRPGGPLVFLGAVAAAMLTVWLTQGLRAAGGLTEDAGAGVVFTTLFAIGVVLVGLAPPGTHLDAACVLYGELAFLPFDTISIAGQPVPRAFVAGATVLAGLVAAAVATWKLQVFTAFDPAGARMAGIPVVGVTTGLLAATAVATRVLSFNLCMLRLRGMKGGSALELRCYYGKANALPVWCPALACQSGFPSFRLPIWLTGAAPHLSTSEISGPGFSTGSSWRAPNARRGCQKILPWRSLRRSYPGP